MTFRTGQGNLAFHRPRMQAPVAAPEARIHVVDDDPIVRDSLREVAATVGLPVATYATAREFLDANEAGVAGCLVLDVRLPGMSGLELQAVLRARQVKVPIIMVTAYADVASAVAALKAGALDFVEKPFSRQLLLERINKALDLDREIRRVETQRSVLTLRLETLTPRERQVMDRVGRGNTNRAIAVDLGLREKTVEVHRAHVMQKMKAASLAELVWMLSVLGTRLE